MRWICSECDKICTDAEMLRAPNPFDAQFEVTGCPACRSAETLIVACDVPSCTRIGGSGTPTVDGYRWTCWQHRPEEVTR